MSTPFLHKAVGFNIFLPCLEKPSLSTRVDGWTPGPARGGSPPRYAFTGLTSSQTPTASRGTHKSWPIVSQPKAR